MAYINLLRDDHNLIAEYFPFMISVLIKREDVRNSKFPLLPTFGSGFGR